MLKWYRATYIKLIEFDASVIATIDVQDDDTIHGSVSRKINAIKVNTNFKDRVELWVNNVNAAEPSGFVDKLNVETSGVNELVDANGVCVRCQRHGQAVPCAGDRSYVTGSIRSLSQLLLNFQFYIFENNLSHLFI